MEEKLLYTARTHPKALFRAGVIQLCLLLLHILILKYYPNSPSWDFADKWGQLCLHGVILVFEVWYVVIPALQWWSTQYTLTNRRVKTDWGVLYKQSREIDLRRIASISEERGILDRIFGCGSLNFYDAASEEQPQTRGAWNRKHPGTGVRFHDVPKVKEVRTMVEQAKYSARPQVD